MIGNNTHYKIEIFESKVYICYNSIIIYSKRRSFKTVIYNAGALIKKLRIQKNLTQTQLADGIIDRSTLSKLENGQLVSDKYIIDMLLQRLGFNSNQNLNYYYNEKEFKVQNKIDRIDSLLKQRKTDEVEQLIKELENDDKFMTDFNTQFILCAKASNIINKKGDLSQAMEFLQKAIKITIPLFNEKNIPDYLLTDYDLKAINMMSAIHYLRGDIDKAIDILFSLKESLEKNCVDIMQLGKNYPMVIYNLTKYLGLSQRGEEAIKLCDKGKDICIGSGNYKSLPLITLNKSYCLFELGYLKESKKLALQAYYSTDMLDMHSSRENVKGYIKEKFNIALD